MTERLFVKILITLTINLIKIHTGCNVTIQKMLEFLLFYSTNFIKNEIYD